ncbi:hypothetical protein CALCODRAFT_516464 [Calocera cornea HHB12733]|uniref:Exonuclease domain-containing protein n=1 Tax=Calocera cornea HHB12733 TaxID=1353952 RepID=A0A165H5B0_9BASI|nr:hypothetical protein CALCODRAFT_516464 [Calocera cornea HHB12733]
MAYSHSNVNGSITLIDGRDEVPRDYTAHTDRNEAPTEDGTGTHQDIQDQEDHLPTDAEIAGHAVSLATQWVVASNGEHLLSRVSIRDYSQDSIYDTFVRPPPSVQITDYRTEDAELDPADLSGHRAVDFETAQIDVSERLQGKLLIGYRLWDSLHLLNLPHPLGRTRDVSMRRTPERYRFADAGALISWLYIWTFNRLSTRTPLRY